MQSIKLLTIAVLGLGFGTACERIVPEGGMLTLEMGESISGSPGVDDAPAKPAVRVEPGAQLGVVAAFLTGGGALVSRPGNPSPGQGILARSAQVTVAGGTVTGGSVLLQAGPQGTFRGADGVQVMQSLLIVSGGQIRGGEAPPPGSRGDGVRAIESTVLVEGGDIDSLSLIGTNGILVGGRIGRLSLSSAFSSGAGQPLALTPPPPVTAFGPRTSCVDLVGGQVQGPIFLSAASLFIAGSSFNLPFGDVLPTAPGVEQIRLTGVLGDGNPIDVVIHREGSRLVLLRSPPPGGPIPFEGNLVCLAFGALS